MRLQSEDLAETEVGLPTLKFALSFYLSFFFKKNINLFNWRLITLLYYSGFAIH